MRRIAAVLALSLCAAVPALAQDRTTLPLVAMLRVNTPDTVEPGATMFRTASTMSTSQVKTVPAHLPADFPLTRDKPAACMTRASVSIIASRSTRTWREST